MYSYFLSIDHDSVAAFPQGKSFRMSVEKKELEKIEIIRDCDDYHQEYTACKSLSNRIHTYYAYGYLGTKEKCASWRDMYDLCMQWKKYRNDEARETLQGMEKALADDVVRNRTNVWTYRDSPPVMWHFPGKLRREFNANSEG